MSEAIGMISFIVFATISIAIVGTVVYIVVQALRVKDNKKTKFQFPTKTLFHIYLYLISFLTLIIALIGGAIAIKSALAYQFGTPFSYTLYKGSSFEEARMYDTTISKDTFEICPDAEVLTIGDADFCFDSQMPNTDLIVGLTLLLSMGILFAIHEFAISKITKEDKSQWLEKIYLFASLILYSIIGLISIPVSIYQLTNFLLLKPENYSYSTPDAPGMAIGMAVLSLPLWIYFLSKTSGTQKKTTKK
ncbi:MAG: hypothetical protein PHG60_01360 [Candidatus Dojkabacteria bacterium]|nr:hypothetical protein [Candidatus Dojkabacteria bacterium]